MAEHPSKTQYSQYSTEQLEDLLRAESDASEREGILAELQRRFKTQFRESLGVKSSKEPSKGHGAYGKESFSASPSLNSDAASLEPESENFINHSFYYTIAAKHSNKCLTVSGASLNEGATIVQFDNVRDSHQQWKFTPVGDKYYRIISKYSEKSIGLMDQSRNERNHIVQWDYSGLDIQKWKLDKAKDGYYWIVSKHNGMYIYNGIFDAGWAVCQHKNNDEDSCWKPVLAKDGYYRIVSARNGWCLSVKGKSEINGKYVIRIGYKGEPNQQWKLVPLEDGFYKIEAKHSGKVLTVHDDAFESSRAIYQLSCEDTPHQLWQVVPSEKNYYKIVSRLSGKCLDVLYASTWNNSGITQFESNDSDNQKWRIERVVDQTPPF